VRTNPAKRAQSPLGPRGEPLLPFESGLAACSPDLALNAREVGVPVVVLGQWSAPDFEMPRWAGRPFGTKRLGAQENS
jgi:hypothetical protein